VHVLLVNQFFYPDVAATAQLATDLAQDLVHEGFRVTAIASRGTYLGGEKRPPEEEHEGIRILRVSGSSFGKATLFHRVPDYVTFFASASVRTLRVPSPDIVLAMSTPPLIAAIGVASSTLRSRARFVYWAQDLYPDLAIAMGVLKEHSVATRALLAVARATLSRADAVVTLGTRMAERLIDRGASPERVHVVPNWADPNAVRPIPHPENPFRATHGLHDRRVVMYSGNIGRGHDVATILAAAESLREEKDIVFLFVGDGAKRELVEAAARGNPSIRLLPYQPRSALSASLSAGDVHLVSQDADTEGLMEPSKLYGVMAAGRPVLYVGPDTTEAAATVIREGIGRRVANGDVQGVTEAILHLLRSGSASGARARSAMERSYGRQTRTGQMAKLLRTLA
jgi:colanic acid biosynthesis glycosyl transferase WcaI